MKDGTISHQGFVESVTNDLVKVRITSMSACSACHAKGACNASDQEEKIIDALSSGKTLKVGDWVTVWARESMGFKALFLGYLLPFLLVLTTLIICTSLNLSEIKAGLFSLAVLIPYYTVLYFTRDTVKKSFIFEIKQ
jgi:sigma-E factor negative regulatory protein RseC